MTDKRLESKDATAEQDQLLLEEVSIMEIEERLEFAPWCDISCHDN